MKIKFTLIATLIGLGISSIASAQQAISPQSFAYDLGFVVGASPQTSCEKAALLTEKTPENIKKCRDGVLNALNASKKIDLPENKILSPYEMGQNTGNNIRTSCKESFIKLTKHMNLSISEQSFTTNCVNGAIEGFKSNPTKPIQQLKDMRTFFENLKLPGIEIDVIMNDIQGA